MKIVPTFATQDNMEGLFAIHFDNETKNELSKCYDNWLYDTEHLFDFFSANIIDLQSGYFGKISISDAIKSTREQAKHLFRLLKELAIIGINGNNENLSIAFEPLDNNEYRLTDLQRVKGKSKYNQNWLRVYAVKIGPNTFIVTGGAIKLVGRMQEDSRLLQEKRKLDNIKIFLEEIGIIDQEDFQVYILSL